MAKKTKSNAKTAEVIKTTTHKLLRDYKDLKKGDNVKLGVNGVDYFRNIKLIK